MKQVIFIVLMITFLFPLSCNFSNSDKKSKTNDNATPKIDIDRILELDRQDHEKYKNILKPEQSLKSKKHIYEAYERAKSEDERLKKYSDLIKKQPDNPKGYFQLANIKMVGDEAAINYRKAFKLYVQNKKSINDIEKEDFIKTMGTEDIYFSKTDLDNDSKPEILLAKLDGLYNFIIFIIDHESNEWKISDFENVGDYLQNVHIIDMNKNGLADIIFEHMQGGMGSFGFRIYEYDKGIIKEVGRESDKYIHRYGNIKIEDIDSDGLKDIICSFYVELDEKPVKWIEHYKWDGEQYSVDKEFPVKTNNDF